MNSVERAKSVPTIFRRSLPDYCDAATKQALAVSAEEILQALQSGMQVEIINAVIRGSLILRSMVLESEITIEATQLIDRLDCSYAQFKKPLSLKASVFEKDVVFVGSTIDKDVFLEMTIFKEKADFNGFRLTGNLKATGVTFEGEADFESARIGNDVEFTNAVFKKNANFNSAHIEGSALFAEARFEEGEADFGSTRIGTAAVFTNAVFTQSTSFNGARIDGGAFFNAAHFEGEADFVKAGIGSNAEFENAVFTQNVSFNSARIDGSALFNSAHFEGETNFGTVYTEQNVLLDRARFEKSVSFQNSRFGTVFFGPFGGSSMTCSFQEKIDWRRCTYDHIHPTCVWKDLMDRLDPYDRQPYTQLEGMFRKSGDDGEATEVYYRRKRVESKGLKLFQCKPLEHHVFRWLADRFLWLVTGYGVRLRRILVPTLIILFLGAFVFQLKGAVEPKQEAQVIIFIGAPVCAARAVPKIDFWDGFWIGLHHFLPVEIPAGSQWKPTSNSLCAIQTRWGKVCMSFEAFATLLKLAGWILVPIGVAGLTGILKR